MSDDSVASLPGADPADAPVASKLRFAVRYIDRADQIVTETRAAVGQDPIEDGREVQGDMQYLAEWFDGRPKLARAATNHLNRRRREDGG